MCVFESTDPSKTVGPAVVDRSVGDQFCRGVFETANGVEELNGVTMRPWGSSVTEKEVSTCDV